MIRRSAIYGGILKEVGGHPSTKETDNFIYYDATITNTSNTETKDAIFKSTGSETVLKNPSDYAVAVYRFSIPTDEIPLVDLQSFYATSAVYTSGSPTVQLSSFSYGQNLMQVGMLLQSSSFSIIPANTVLNSFVRNSDGTSSVTMSKNATSSSTDIMIGSQYIVSMETKSGLFASFPVAIGSTRRNGFQSYIYSINGAIQACFAYLKFQDNSPGPAVIVQTDSPFLMLDNSSQLISMAGSQYYWYYNGPGGNVSTNYVRLFFNTNLYNLVKGLPAIFQSDLTSIPFDFCNYEIWLGDLNSGWSGINNITVTPTGYYTTASTTSGSAIITLASGAYNVWVGQNVVGTGIPASTTIISVTDSTHFTMSANATATSAAVNIRTFSPSYTANVIQQTSPSLYAWSPVQRIVFTTGSVPVNSEVIQNPSLFSTGLVTDININQYRPLLVDFLPPATTDDLSPLEFYAQDPVRWNDLTSSPELRTIDIQVYWIDKFGNYNLIQIPPNDKCGILLAFVNKKHLQ